MKDRLDMLKKLSFIDDKQLKLFKSYIPNHYGEIYTLYSIFQKASIDYNLINFDKPIEEDNSFIFLCILNDNLKDKLTSYINKNNSFELLRKHPYIVNIDKDGDYTKIIFLSNN